MEVASSEPLGNMVFWFSAFGCYPGRSMFSFGALIAMSDIWGVRFSSRRSTNRNFGALSVIQAVKVTNPALSVCLQPVHALKMSPLFWAKT
jgi:hypothetical protein